MTVSTHAKVALNLITQFQIKLNLSHWRIDVSSVAPKNGALFEVVTNRLRNHASVRISDEGMKHPDCERMLKHELLHIVLDPIREEHDLQMEALQTERSKEYSMRMLRQIERAVEHLSYVL